MQRRTIVRLSVESRVSLARLVLVCAGGCAMGSAAQAHGPSFNVASRKRRVCEALLMRNLGSEQLSICLPQAALVPQGMAESARS